MTPAQMKAARLLLGWNQTLLAARSGTSVHSVRAFEWSGQAAKLYGRTGQVDVVAVIRATLEVAGIEFTEGDAPGVQMRKQGS